MISLFLNTSSNCLNIGLFRDGVLIKEIYKKLDRDLSRETIFLINSLLDDANVSCSMVDEVICVRGPGSFTGLRVGVTIAKTFAYFLNKKLYSISSLEVMALSCDGDIIVPIIDARRGYVYGAIYDKSYNVLMEECYIELSKLLEIVKGYSGEKVFVSNDEFSFSTINFVPMLNRLFDYDFKRLEDSMSFAPTYLKRTEAEENLYDKKNN